MRDRSGNSHHGAYIGTTLAHGIATSGQRMPYFDGLNDSGTMPSSLDGVFPANEGTLVLWVKLHEPDDFDYYFAFRDGAFEFYVQRTAITRIAGDARTISVSTPDASDETEHHLAVSWSVSENRMRRYKNGQMTHQITDINPYAVTPPATTRLIGAAANTTHVLRGWIHDVALVGRELSGADIMRLAV